MRKRSTLFGHIDLGLVIPSFVLVVLSLTTLFSINSDLFKSQAGFFVFSLFAFLFFSQVHPKIIQTYTFPMYGISLCLLFAVLIIGIETRGAVRWIDVMGFNIQFSEILRPFLGVALCSFLASRDRSFSTFFLSIVFLLPIAFLIYLQPDLGNALIYVLVTMLTLFVYGFPVRLFILGIIGFFLSLPIVWHFLHDYQKQRILTFINPAHDPLGTSYNAIQSLIAIGSGSIFGRGLRETTQSGLRFLPERHTDFIFATLSEGLGFVGGMLVIGAFALLLYRMYVVFSTSSDNFSKIFAAFCFVFILSQFFINIGMNIGVVPVVGVTLPFISYGGSSLLANFILLGLLSSMSTSAETRDVLEIR